MLNHLVDGGIMMVILVTFSIFSIAVVIDRFRAFMNYRKVDNRALRAQVMRLIREDEVDEAILLCHDTPGPVSAVMLAGLLAYRKAQHNDAQPAATAIAAKEAMDDFSVHAISAVERRFGILTTVGNAAPLVGMLGTVVGMIASFAALSADGVSNEEVAAGISVALVTTAGGLVVALMAVIPYNWFVSLSDSIDLEIEEIKAQFVDAIV